MNYLQLPQDKFIEFVEDLRRRYGLIVVERPAKVDLDESRYGKVWDAYKKTYTFSRVNEKGEKEHITCQNGDGTTLYAVSEVQFKSWSKWQIVSEPTKWSLGRFAVWMAQVSYRNDLISPAEDLRKLDTFLRRIFHEGEKYE